MRPWRAVSKWSVAASQSSGAWTETMKDAGTAPASPKCESVKGNPSMTTLPKVDDMAVEAPPPPLKAGTKRAAIDATIHTSVRPPK